nr:laccase-3-like [Ipomoea batatas]
MESQKKTSLNPFCNGFLAKLFVMLTVLASLANADVYHQEFVVQETKITRLCKTKTIITVNGQFPGPTVAVRNGDDVVIKVTNRGRYNVTIHWHGLRQMRTPWADGPEYVTQCPIMPGGTYTYRFKIENQEGTLWWHAHSRWLRATVYGAFIIYPKAGSHFPFSQPKKDIPILLGEWWTRDIIALQRQTQFTGAAPNISNAYTINGQPGDLYRCSSQDTVKFSVSPGETVLLRVINAALNQQLFFSVANHKLQVVGADAAYNKPFTTNVIMVGPGQTTNVLLTADQPPARYYIAARAYATAQNNPFDNTTTTAVLEYTNLRPGANSRPLMPQLPFFNDTATATAFTTQLRSVPSNNPTVFKQPDESLFFTVGLGLVNCTPGPRCQGPNNTRFAASMNNVSFVLPRRTSLLQAYYNNVPGIYTVDFPPVPPVQFDYTGNVSRGLWQPPSGTKLYKIKYGSRVQVVLQDTAIVTTEDHPIHLHGYHFWVVGQGFGNFNPQTDTAKFNLVDPPVRNTIDVPVGGWAVIRFFADNPGVWLMHCHIDSHLAWGLAMAFIVENGQGESQTVEPPPLDLPRC